MTDGPRRLTLADLPDRRATVEAALGLKIPDEVLQYQPLGRRLVVARERAEERTKGGLYKPQQAIREVNAGYLLAVGHEVGLHAGEGLAGLGLVFGPEPRDYLGARVSWGAYRGWALQVDDRDDDFTSRFLVMLEEDILMVRWAEGPGR